MKLVKYAAYFFVGKTLLVQLQGNGLNLGNFLNDLMWNVTNPLKFSRGVTVQPPPGYHAGT